MKNEFRSLVDRRLEAMQWTPELQHQVLNKLKGEIPMRKRLSFAMALCIILLCCSIAALAYTMPNVLKRLYGSDEEVGQRQIDMVQPVSVSESVAGVTISIDEAIYDGQRFAVYWTIENTSSKPVLITETGSTFNEQTLYSDFSSMGVFEGQIVLPGETLDGGFISISGYTSAGTVDSVRLCFNLFSLLRPVEFVTYFPTLRPEEIGYSAAELSYEEYWNQVQQLYDSNPCVVVNAQSRMIEMDPSLDLTDFDDESATGTFYEVLGLVQKQDEIFVDFEVDSSAVAVYSELETQQVVSVTAYPVTLTAVTISPITTYFGFTIESEAGFNQKYEANDFYLNLTVEYFNGDGTELVFLDGEYTGDSSIEQNSNGEYYIFGKYPLPGLAQVPDEIILQMRLKTTNEIIAQFIIQTP